MLDVAKPTKEKIVDVGIEKGAEFLTTEKIQSVIQETLKAEGGARLKTYVETCVH